MDKIVVIEAEKNLGEKLRSLFEKISHHVDLYHSAEDFFLAKKFYTSCVYIIDSNLPGIRGLEVIRMIRSKDKLSPIFMISEFVQGKDITEGLAAGADDFLPKPLNTDHLLQKVKNSMDKTRIIQENLMNVGTKLIPEANSIIHEGDTVNLTSREFIIMNILLKTPGKIATREELVAGFDDSEVTTRTIDVHVSALRKKLEKIELSISTVRGKGYKIER